MRDLKLNNFLDFLIEFFYLSVIFFIPIYFGFFLNSAHPFDFQKMVLFKILLFFLIFFSSIKFIFYFNFKKIFVKLFNKYFYIAFFVLLFSLLSVFWSVNPHLSFYGSLDRQAGWLNEFYIFLFFIILTLNLVIFENKSNKIRNILITLVISSAVVSFYAIFQFFGLDFIVWEEPALETGRAMSTLGQPNFLGSFLLLTLPFSLCLMAGTKNFYLKVAYILLFLVQFLALFFSGSRGAWVGLLLASFFILLFFYYKKNKKIFFSGILIIIIFFSFLSLGNNVISQRFQQSFNTKQGSVSVRAYIWEASLKVLDNRDWGYGLENQKEALWEFYQPDWAINNKVNVVFDRAHNLLLDIVLTVGLFGLFFYLWLYYFVFKLAIKNIRENKNVVISLAAFWALAAYLISLFFNFSVVVTNIYFWLIVSLLIVLNFNPRKTVIIKYSRKEIIYKKGLVLIILLFCLFGIWREIKSINTDYYFLKFKHFFSYQEFPAAIVTFSYLREDSPIYYEYYYYFIDMVFNNYEKFKNKALDYMVKEEIYLVFLELEKDKNNKSFSYNIAKAQASAILENFSDSDEIFKDLQWKSPNYPRIYFNRAKAEIIKENYEVAKDYLEITLNLLPSEDELDSKTNLKALKSYKNKVSSEIILVDNLINN